jgi:hypothetical protein
VTDVPERLTLKRNRDLAGISDAPWSRRVILSLILVFLALGLANVFGQRPGTSTAATPEARLELYAPTHLRGGLLFSARFHVYAREDVENAILILDPGWLESMAVNTIEPSPVGEASDNGRLTLQLGHIPKGSSHLLFMQFQVNPTNVAWRRSADVELADGSTPLLRIRHHFTIYP